MKKFTRSSSDRLFAGVFGGIGRRFEIQSMVIRLVAVLMCLTGAGTIFIVIGYFWAIAECPLISDEEYQAELAKEKELP